MAFDGVFRGSLPLQSTAGQRCPTELLQRIVTVGRENKFSMLPNDILVSIISLLDMKQAFRTSVLSSSFRNLNLWAHYSGSLDFHDQEFLVPLEETYSDFADKEHKLRLKRLEEKGYTSDVEEERSYDDVTEKLWYFNWVNHVISRHKAPAIEEFRVTYILRLSDTQTVDSWLDFALQKSDIKRLNLNLNPLCCYYTDERDHYCFPQKYLDVISSNSSEHSAFRYLTVFSINYVNVSGEFIKNLLVGCPLLEQLCVVDSDHLVDMMVSGSSLKLKHLEVVNCWKLKTLEICEAPHLVFLKFYGKTRKTKLHVKNVPRLKELHANGTKDKDMINYPVKSIFDSLSHHLPQLSVLHICVVLCIEREEWDLPMMNNLEELYVDVYIGSYDLSVHPAYYLFKVIHNVRKFTFTFAPWEDLDEKEYPYEKNFIQRRLRYSVQKLNKLEEVTIFGFRGYKIDSEFLLLYFKYAPSIKKVVLDRRIPHYSHVPSIVNRDMGETHAKVRALELKEKLPCDVDFIFI